MTDATEVESVMTMTDSTSCGVRPTLHHVVFYPTTPHDVSERRCGIPTIYFPVLRYVPLIASVIRRTSKNKIRANVIDWTYGWQ